MQVTVQKICGRCGKEEDVTMSIEAAQELETNENARIAAAEALAETLNATLSPLSPDVIIAVRGPSGNYSVTHMSNLCNNPGAARNKGCLARVAALIQDITNTAEKKPSVPRSKKEKKAAKEEE
jgi:hypothetical protein